MNSKDKTLVTWNEIAAIYDKTFMPLDIYNASYAKFCKYLKKKPRVLDVGCGPGMISKYVFSKIPNSEIEGIDNAVNMIALAKKNVPRGDFMTLSATDISKLTGLYDGIISGFCLPYLKKAETKKFLKNCAEKLSANGILYLSYVDGKYSNSHYQTGSSGHQLFFHYYETDYLIARSEKSGFKLLEKLPISYNKADGKNEIHTILIFKKVI